jgi:PDZ domain
MSIRVSLFLLLLITIPQEGMAGDYFAVTPSGSTEVVFAGDSSEIVGQISSKCIDVKWIVISTSSNSVVCEAPLSMGQSVLGQLALGNSYSTPPRRFYRFNLSEIGGVTRVQASGWMETQMPFGQIKRFDFSGAEFHNSIMGFMAAAGGKLPLGTTFPNHVYIGFNMENIQNGKYRALKVTEVLPNTAASRAGLEIGDLVTRIAGRNFKDDEQYLEAVAKAAKSETYKLELNRNNQTITLTLDREFRPPYTEQVVASNPNSKKSESLASSTSVADELAKLLKLKEQGVLNQAEFDAQKAKLLSQ